MPDFRAPIRANQNAIIAALLDPRTADPAPMVAGQVWFRSDLNELRIAISAATSISFRRTDIGIVNADVAANAAIALSKLATDPLARANHTGTQAASTISDFTTVRDQQRLDQHAAPTADITLNNRKITSLADPTAAQDAATKAYVDGISQGLDVKPSVRAATTTNLAALSGAQTVDAIALVAGDRVLVKDQTTQSANGIYVVAAGAWARASDADTWTELVSAFTFVEQGTVNADTGWTSTADQGGTLGTTAVPWSQFSGAGQVVAGNGLTKTGNSVDVVGGTGITVAADLVSVDTAVVARKVTATINGTGALGSFNVVHSLNNTRPLVQVWEESSGTQIELDITSVSASTVNVSFALPPANGAAFSVVVIG